MVEITWNGKRAISHCCEQKTAVVEIIWNGKRAISRCCEQKTAVVENT